MNKVRDGLITGFTTTIGAGLAFVLYGLIAAFRKRRAEEKEAPAIDEGTTTVATLRTQGATLGSASACKSVLE